METRRIETWKKNLWILAAGSLVASASYSMVIPFLPLYLQQLGVRSNLGMWSGVIFSISFLAGAIVAPVWGAVSDRYGRRPMVIRSGIALTVIYILTAWVTNPYQLVGLRLLMGLLSGYIPSSIALVGSSTPTAYVGTAMAVMSTATSVGGIVGPLLGGVSARLVGYPSTFVVAGVAVFFATVLVFGWVRETEFKPSNRRFNVLRDLSLAFTNRVFTLVLLTNMLSAFSIMTIEPLLPLYVVQLGIPSSSAALATGIVFSILGLASILFAPLWGRLGDRSGFPRILAIGLLGGGIGNIAQMFFQSIWVFGVIRFIYGAFFCAVFPAINALTVKATDQEYRGRAFGISQSANQVGTLLGPLVGGAIGDLFGIHQVFIVTGLLLIATLTLVWSSRRVLDSAG